MNKSFNTARIGNIRESGLIRTADSKDFTHTYRRPELRWTLNCGPKPKFHHWSVGETCFIIVAVTRCFEMKEMSDRTNQIIGAKERRAWMRTDADLDGQWAVLA